MTELMKAIDMEDVVSLASNPETEVYMLVRVFGDTTIDELSMATGFYKRESPEAPAEEETEQKAEQDKPKATRKPKAKKEVNHGRIVALYKANRSVKWIADDMNVSAQTVINHLVKEGIYESRKAGTNKGDL